MITIAICNSKGGVGKSTVAAALAVRACADKSKNRVAVADLDPQKSLEKWWQRRGRGDSPKAIGNVSSIREAQQRAEGEGFDWLFVDGPPAFLVTLEEMIQAADLAVIPMKPSTSDMLSTEDAVVIARDAETPFLIVFSDVVADRDKRLIERAEEALFSFGLPIAKAKIVHRTSHITGMNAGKTAAEVNGGKDKSAVDDIDRLWAEVKTAATKAVKARPNSQEGAAAHD